MTDLLLTDLHASGAEKGQSLALAFRNEDVSTLTWEKLSVKVADRATGKEKFILSEVCGQVYAGVNIH